MKWAIILFWADEHVTHGEDATQKMSKKWGDKWQKNDDCEPVRVCVCVKHGILATNKNGQSKRINDGLE